MRVMTVFPNTQFDKLILSLAKSHWPQGWDVGPNAPDNFSHLKAEYAARGRITVFNGVCDNTIYGSPEVNYAFRAWHDALHIAHNLGFDTDSEIKVSNHQVQQVRQAQDISWVETHCFSRWVAADVAGQALYYRRHKRFVQNQRAFVEAYMYDPVVALEHFW